jgi:hypothetical protein
MLRFDLVKHLQSIGIWQLQIEQDKCGFLALEKTRSGRGGSRDIGVVAMPAQQGFERQLDRTLVIDDKNAPVLSHGSGSPGRLGLALGTRESDGGDKDRRRRIKLRLKSASMCLKNTAGAEQAKAIMAAADGFKRSLSPVFGIGGEPA